MDFSTYVLFIYLFIFLTNNLWRLFCFVLELIKIRLTPNFLDDGGVIYSLDPLK